VKQPGHNSTILHFDIGGYGRGCHEIEWKQFKLWYRRAEGAYMWQPATELIPSPEAWERFWRAVEIATVWQWENRYENLDILDGTQWSLKLKHQGRTLSCYGSNAYPGSDQPNYPEMCHFGQFVQALRELTGQASLG
jgi:hypothetical protein